MDMARMRWLPRRFEDRMAKHPDHVDDLEETLILLSPNSTCGRLKASMGETAVACRV